MTCPTKRNEDAEILLDYCAQTLSPVQRAEFEIHLKQCADCSRLVDAQKEVWGALEAWTPPEVSINFDARLYARIAQEQTAPAWQLWLRRIFQPPIPYPLWKSAVPLAAACAGGAKISRSSSVCSTFSMSTLSARSCGCTTCTASGVRMANPAARTAQAAAKGTADFHNG